MKLCETISVFVACCLLRAASHSLRRGNKQLQPNVAQSISLWKPVSPVAAPLVPEPVVAPGGDYYTKASTGENAGDPVRGKQGSCTAWRRTLNCNPSGPRDEQKDKACDAVVNADESGFCECGNYVQFATVDCNHRAFTCETMCLKYAVLTGLPAVVKNAGTTLTLDVEQAKNYLNTQMFGEQDMTAMTKMAMEFNTNMDRFITHAATTGKTAKDSIKNYMGNLTHAQELDRLAAAKAMESFNKLAKRRPFKAMEETGDEMIKLGKAMQKTVSDVLPVDPRELASQLG